jgi:prepilin-type N-terminal cleavage/methylation domain-containing protein
MKHTTDDLKLKPASNASKRGSGSTSGRGFTIIEVLIVLSIAGLIMLIVFEAIPSLTRALRNGRRKQDISVILDAVSNYELKDSDNFPKNCSGDGSTACNVCDGTGTPAQIALECASTDPPNDYFLHFAQSSLSYYTYTSTSWIGVEEPVSLTADYPQNNGKDPGPNTNTELVKVFDYEKCDSNGDGGTTSVGADYNDVVALYALENGTNSPNTGTPQCQQL